MFSSLKLNSLKCQSNSESDKKNKCDIDDDVSDHTYEKLPNLDNKPCKCHLNNLSKSPKSQKIPLSKRISRWRMECPGITNLRVSRPADDLESKNNQEDISRELINTKFYSNVRTKVTTVNIQREDGNLGITLRGGFHRNEDISKPVTITYIKPDGPAAKEGTIKPGDRLLAVDGVSLQGSSLSEAQTLLKQSSISTLLTIEYDVNVLDSVEHANGPLLIEIERTSSQELGLTLYQNEDGVIVERVKPGSLADRCGALHIGDEILAVNDTRIDGSPIGLEDVVKLLECDCPVIRLEILPSYAVVTYSSFINWRNREHVLSPSSSLSGVSTLKSHTSRRNRECQNGEPSQEIINDENYSRNLMNATCFYGSNIALIHCESLHTTITRENGSFGIQFIDSPNGAVLIHSITPAGPADRSQCLHPGDRVLSVNHRNVTLDRLTAKDVNDIINNKSDDIPCNKLNLHTEFDVLDTVVPASGIFTVKLAKRGTSGLGITITASKASGFMVCEMKKGSIAYRAGSLIPGDKLLAINNIPLDQCSVEYAAHILHQSTDIVTLRVQRVESQPDLKNNRRVIYTVELQRYGGPLGITIAGSEEPFQPITVSGLTSGGLAEQTGVLHIGDEILAINNHSLYGEPLSKAHALLQNSSDLVTLKISRSILPFSRAPNNRSPVFPSSIDSAVESWDSSHLDLTSSPDHQKNSRDSKDYMKRNYPLIPLIQRWTSPDQTSVSPNGNNISSEGKNSDLALLDKITSENLKMKEELDLLSIKLDEQCQSSFQTEPTDSQNGALLDNLGDASNLSKNSPITKSLEKLKIDSQPNGNWDQQSEVKKSEDEIEKTIRNATSLHENFVFGYNERDRESFATNDFENFEMSYLPDTRDWFKTPFIGSDNNQNSLRNEFHPSQLHKVTLYKDPIYEDFGFSVSDGLYERGVFINRIRKGGPADLSHVLKPYDRILQVNETCTQDFDCCLTVPLIASAGDSLNLLVARNHDNYTSNNGEIRNEKSGSKEILVSSQIENIKMEYDEPQRILV